MGRAGSVRSCEKLGSRRNERSKPGRTSAQASHGRWSRRCLLTECPRRIASDPIGWREEVAGIVAKSACNSGLPEPIAVRVEKTPFFRGHCVRCPARPISPAAPGGFRCMWPIEFDRPVQGPVLIGAGRFADTDSSSMDQQGGAMSVSIERLTSFLEKPLETNAARTKEPRWQTRLANQVFSKGWPDCIATFRPPAARPPPST